MDSPVPVKINGVTGVMAVAARLVHSVALKSDGSVWAWGDNSSGQLGNNSIVESHIPVQVTGLSGVVAVAAGSYYSVALKSDGSVWAWGENIYGQLGDNSTVNSYTPVQVTGLSEVIAVAAGSSSSLALKSDGSVWAWGSNSSTTPVQVTGLSGVIAVAAGGSHSLALKSDGSVWAWGSNGYGQLGNNSTVDSPVPIEVPGLSGVVALAASTAHSTVLKNDGSVWTWGYNDLGQLGNGFSTASSTTPGQVTGLSGVVAVAAGGMGHTLALKSDGSAWAWGSNSSGQLGNPINYLKVGRSYSASIITISLFPVQVIELDNVVLLDKVTAISAKYAHTLTLKNDGSVWAWGSNRYGELGNNSTVNSPVPLQTTDLSGAIAVAAGYDHSLAIRSDGSVWAWGRNNSGQLGNNSTVDSHIPVKVTGLSGVAAVAAGGSHSIALSSDGSVWAWGENSSGQLGINSTVDSRIPVKVAGLSSVIAVAVGGFHSLALKSDGSVWAWGHNSSGQLGKFNSTVHSPVPIQIAYLSGVIAVAAGNYHSLALKSDGSVWAWGYNSSGQLGIDSLVNMTTPIKVTGLTGVVSIAAGSSHSVALKSDGSVWAWGSNSSGQFGNNSTVNSHIPVQATGLVNMGEIISIAAGGSYTAALRRDGILLSVGSNSFGELGDNLTGGANNWTISLYFTQPRVHNLNMFYTNNTLTIKISENAASITYPGNRVVSNPSTITCSANSCSGGFDYGAQVTLSAIAAPGFVFNGWSGGGCSGTASCTVTMSADISVNAEFLPGFPLSLTIAGTGEGSVNGDMTCTSGTTCPQKLFVSGGSVSLLQTPDIQSTFSGWSGACTGGGNCSLTMDSAKTVTATFTLAPKAMVDSIPFTTLQSAYNDNATTNGSIIKLLEGIHTNSLLAGKDIAVQIEGGYNAEYSGVSTETTIQGPLRIKAGTVRMKGVKVK